MLKQSKMLNKQTNRNAGKITLQVVDTIYLMVQKRKELLKSDFTKT